jgi:hypothetical protein
MSDQTDAGRPSNELTDALLKGRYTIEKELGRGGIGVVYLARYSTSLKACCRQTSL